MSLSCSLFSLMEDLWVVILGNSWTPGRLRLLKTYSFKAWNMALHVCKPRQFHETRKVGLELLCCRAVYNYLPLTCHCPWPVSNWESEKVMQQMWSFHSASAPWCSQVGPHLHLSPIQPLWAQTPSPANSTLGFQTLTLDLCLWPWHEVCVCHSP